MIHALDNLELTGVEHFHEDGYRAANRSVAGFISADSPLILYPEQRSELALCKASPLTNCRECGRAQTATPSCDFTASMMNAFSGPLGKVFASSHAG